MALGTLRRRVSRCSDRARELVAQGCDECRGRAQVFTTSDPPNPERDEPAPDPRCPRCGAERLVVRIVYRCAPPPHETAGAPP